MTPQIVAGVEPGDRLGDELVSAANVDDDHAQPALESLFEDQRSSLFWGLCCRVANRCRHPTVGGDDQPTWGLRESRQAQAMSLASASAPTITITSPDWRGGGGAIGIALSLPASRSPESLPSGAAGRYSWRSPAATKAAERASVFVPDGEGIASKRCRLVVSR